ncbi:alpha-methylacyl-CoA racemase [Euwallacea similis]|uniref:alpha-methylacyl-CoA racemase n=1 Tax=Euwallacea similis TaxID=1736056 RepID=UPI0034510221
MALKGIRVVEFAGLAPGPFCGKVLSDFGASVIRIDKKLSDPDLDCLGNGKKSLCLNLKSPQAREIVQKLIKTSDVSIEPYRAGVMEKLGLGPEVLLKVNPRLIYARLSGYGHSGPYCHKAGHDINYLALSGLLSLLGRKGEKPMFPVNLLADFGGGGLMCALGIVLALLEREKSGKGQVVEANMVQGTAYLGSFLYKSQNLPLWGNPRGANLLDSGAPFYEVYETKDHKYIAVGALESNFYLNLLKGLGLTKEEAPQYDFENNKIKFERKFLEKTRDEWCEIFENLDACIAPVLELEEAPLHPHNKVQGMFKEGAPKAAPNLSRTPAESTSNSRPRIGENTIEILETVGYSGSDIVRLKDEGVVYYDTAKKSKL